MYCMYRGNFTFISQEQPPHIAFLFLVSEYVCSMWMQAHMLLVHFMCIVQRGQILHIARVLSRSRINSAHTCAFIHVYCPNSNE